MPNFGPRWNAKAPLDKGGQACTFLVEDAQDPKLVCVAKVLNNPAPERKQRFRQEIEATKDFNHFSVVRSLDSRETQKSCSHYFVMPY